MIRGCRKVSSSIILLVFANGCSLAPSMGMRPTAPGAAFSDEVLKGCQDRHPSKDAVYLACLEFWPVYEWGNQLKEAYRSRATLNEWSIYFAGTLGLASLAAVAGIAAVGHGASDSVKIIPIAGGFTSGFFALLDNKARAAAYTEAANEIGLALNGAIEKTKGPSRPYDEARISLYQGIINAENKLETKRSSLAAAAAERKEEIEKLQQEAARAKINAAEAKGLDPATNAKGGDLIKLTIGKIDLTEFDWKKDFKVQVGSKDATKEIVSVGFDTVTFRAPVQDAAGPYDVILQIRDRPVPPPQKLIYE
jgi:hypothetical protein